MKKIYLIFILFVANFYLASAQENKAKFKFENYVRVKDFLDKQNLTFNENDLYIFETFDDFVEYNDSGFLKSPVIHVFNSDGLYLEFIEPIEVMAKLSDFKKIKNKPKKDALHLETWFSGFINCRSMNTIKKEEGKDFYFVLNWAVFSNQPHKIKELFKWYDVLQRQQLSGENIQIVLLNMDLQDSWNLTQEKKENILKQANRE